MKNKKRRTLLPAGLKWFLLLLILFCLAFTYFTPRLIMYSDYLIIRGMSFFLIVLFIPLLTLITLLLFGKQYKVSMACAGCMVLIVGPTFGLFKDYREMTELKKYGVWTNSIVTNRKPRGRGIGSEHWLIKCKYVVKNQNFETSYEDDIYDLHPIGDTIKIIYSGQFPKIYRLINDWKK